MSEFGRDFRFAGRPYAVAKAAERRGEALTCVRPEEAAVRLAESQHAYADLGASCRCLVGGTDLGRPAGSQRPRVGGPVRNSMTWSPRCFSVRHPAQPLDELRAAGRSQHRQGVPLHRTRRFGHLGQSLT